MLARAAAALQVRPGEGRLVGLLVLLMFLPSAGGAIGSPSIEALFYARFGVQYLPFMYVALGFVTLFTSLLLTALLGRASRRRLYLTLPVVLGAALIVARVLVGLRLNWFYPVLWLGMYLFWTLQGSLTWGLAGTVCNTRQAKRLFPLFGAGGILGVAVGGLITSWLVIWLGTENLLFVWAGALLASFVIVRSLTAGLRERRARRPGRLVDDVARGYQFVRRSPLMRWVALAALLLSLLSYTIAFPFSKAVAQQFPNVDALTGFLGVFQGLTTAVAFLAALILANRFYAWLGFMGALLALPLIYLGGFSLLLATTGPAFTVLVTFRFIQMAWTQGISGTAYQAIFNVAPPAWREQARAFVDGVPTQLGTVLVGVVLIVGGSHLQPWHLYAGGAAAAALAVLVIWRARRAYGAALAEALRAGQPQVFLSEQQPFGGFQRDAAAVQALLGGLAERDPVVRRVAAEILGSVHLPAATGAAVEALSDPDSQVRVAALHSLATAQAASALLEVVIRLGDPEPEVRLAAIETLRQLAGYSAGLALHLRPRLDDPDPSVRTHAALALLHIGADVQAAATLLALARSAVATERVMALSAMGNWADPAAYDVAAAGANDANASVRCAAVRAVARISGRGSMELLIEALGDETAMVRESAAGVLAGMGAPALSAIMAALAQPRLEEGALIALRQLPRQPPTADLLSYARTKVSLGLQYAGWRQAVAALDTTSEPLRLLSDSLWAAARTQALRAIEAVGLLDETGATRLVLQGLQSRDPGQQANALEMIDSWNRRDLVRPVLTLWETAAPSGPGQAVAGAAGAAAVLSPVLHDADPWLRACAAYAAGQYPDAGLQGQLAQLIETDSDDFVRDTALAATAAGQGAFSPANAAGGATTMDTLATLSVMDRILFLRRVRLFSDLPPSELKQVAAITNEQYYLNGEVIARQGDPGDEMYIIISGEVRVTADAGSHSPVELARRGPGEYVGEMALISQEPRIASLVALGDVRVLHIEQAQFEAILRERPETSLAVMRVLCARLKEVQQRELASL
jgi:HEAT repeat protein